METQQQPKHQPVPVRTRCCGAAATLGSLAPGSVLLRLLASERICQQGADESRGATISPAPVHLLPGGQPGEGVRLVQAPESKLALCSPTLRVCTRCPTKHTGVGPDPLPRGGHPACGRLCQVAPEVLTPCTFLKDAGCNPGSAWHTEQAHAAERNILSLGEQEEPSDGCLVPCKHQL